MLKDIYYENPLIAYDHIPIGICIINNNFNIIFWNRTLETWTNIHREDVIFKNIFELFPHLQTPKYKSRLQLMFSGRPPMVLSPMLNEYFIPIKDNEGNNQAQTVTLSSIPTNETGLYNVIIAIENVATLFNKVKQYRVIKNHAIDELNRRIEAEEKLKEYTKKLEQLNSTKDKFFSIIAHDLINPISAQYKLVKILKDNIEQFSKEDIIDIINEIEQSSSHTYKLLENLLTWSRSQLNKFSVNIDKHNLSDIIKLAASDVSSQITMKKITFSFSEDCNVSVCCDNNLLLTILRNLLSNAVKFTNYGGKISVSCRVDDDFTYITVEDSGVGMDEDTLNNLFKLDKTHSKLGTNKEVGTGLGLVICKEFVEKMNGEIFAESKLGEGSKFTIKLPNCPNQ